MANGVVTPIDFSDVTDAVLAEAGRYAKALGAKIWLIHVAAAEPEFVGYEIGPVYVRDSVARQLRNAHQELQVYQDQLRADGLDVTAMLVPGSPSLKVVEEIRELEPQLVVLGSHGHGALHNLLVGSVCQEVLKEAICPVLVVPFRRDDQE